MSPIPHNYSFQQYQRNTHYRPLQSHIQSTRSNSHQSIELSSTVEPNLNINDARINPNQSNSTHSTNKSTTPIDTVITSEAPDDESIHCNDVLCIDALYTNTNVAMKSLVSQQQHYTLKNCSTRPSINNKILCSGTLYDRTLVGYSNGIMKLINHNDINKVTTHSVSDRQIYSVQWLSNTVFTVSTYTGELHTYSIDDHNITLLNRHISTPRNLPNGTIEPVSPINDMTYTATYDKHHLYYALGNGIVSQYNVETNQIIYNFNTTNTASTQYCIKQIDNNSLCSTGLDSIVRVYDVRAKQCIRKLYNQNTNNASQIRSISMDINSTADYITIAYSNNTISTYHIISQLPVYTANTQHQPSRVLYNTNNYCGIYSERLIQCSEYSNQLVHYNSHGTIVSTVDSTLDCITSLSTYNNTDDQHVLVATGVNELLIYSHPFVTPQRVDLQSIT